MSSNRTPMMMWCLLLIILLTFDLSQAEKLDDYDDCCDKYGSALYVNWVLGGFDFLLTVGLVAMGFFWWRDHRKLTESLEAHKNALIVVNSRLTQSGLKLDDSQANPTADAQPVANGAAVGV